MKTSVTKFPLILLVLGCIALSPVRAQPASPSTTTVSRILSDIELKTKYRNCPSGYYNGPRPGKTRFIKDSWIWAVTPEFAQRFCMPPEFVSTELKGAEAIAYKLLKPQDEERCGEQGDPKVCYTRAEHRFEIYYRNGAIPKELPVSYFYGAYLPSSIFISSTRKEWEASEKTLRAKPKYGGLPPFYSEQFGLQSTKDGKVALPLATLSTWIYYEEVFEGIDYLAVEAETGFSGMPGWVASGSRRMAITVRKAEATHEPPEMPLSDFALAIELPQSMADRIVANDRGPGANPKTIKPGAKLKP